MLALSSFPNACTTVIPECFSRESACSLWITVCAGMTNRENQAIWRLAINTGFKKYSSEYNAALIDILLRRSCPQRKTTRKDYEHTQPLPERENEDAFIPGVRELEARLAALKGIVIEDEQVKVARISSAAQPPHQPIKPKRMLIVAVGIVLGGMLGVFAALIRVAIRNRKAANSQTASAQN